MNCEFYSLEIEKLAQSGMLRQIPQIEGQSKWVEIEGQRLLNLSSNDYLGLFDAKELESEFWASFNTIPKLSSASSRLLTGNNEASEEVEKILCEIYNKEAALIFNSGYHANSGIIPALTHKGSYIIADKLVHASMIDGIKLSTAPFTRFRHNDIEHLRSILKREQGNYEQIFILTEGIFSMGGDRGLIKEIVELKEEFDKLVIYVDEAHSFGVCGERGLGVCEELGLLESVDIIVGTMGKAISSVGAYAVMPKIIREYLVNKMRPLIFSTALPPLNIEWSKFIISRLKNLDQRRNHLKLISKILRDFLTELGSVQQSESHIIGFQVGEASRSVTISKELKRRGFYALPVRPPTVPQGESAIRFSLTSSITTDEIESLCSAIKEITENENL